MSTYTYRLMIGLLIVLAFTAAACSSSATTDRELADTVATSVDPTAIGAADEPAAAPAAQPTEPAASAPEADEAQTEQSTESPTEAAPQPTVAPAVTATASASTAAAVAPPVDGGPGCVPGSGSNYSGQTLAQPDFEGDLLCADFSGATLAQADFDNVIADGAMFLNTVLAQPDFDNAQVRFADFSGATLTNPDFENSDLSGTELRAAVMTNADFDNTICPDGSNSNDNGNTCIGNLEVDASVVIEASSVQATAPEPGFRSCTGSYVGRQGETGLVASIEADGVFFLGTADGQEADLAVGTIDENGIVQITADGATVGTGTFDLATCSGSGTWTTSGVTGDWNLGLTGTSVQLDASDCDAGIYVGDGTVSIVGGASQIIVEDDDPSDSAGGGVSITVPGLDVSVDSEGNASITTGDGTSITAGESGASIVSGTGAISIDDGYGSLDLDVNRACLGLSVTTGSTVSFDEIQLEGVTITQTPDGFVSYGLSADLLFAFNSSDVSPDAQVTLDEVVASISTRYPGQSIVVLGHTDAIGSTGYNQGLSEDRASSVVSILAGDARLNANSIEASGLGETQPVSPNTTPDGADNPAGRALNRRVEIIVAAG